MVAISIDIDASEQSEDAVHFALPATNRRPIGYWLTLLLRFVIGTSLLIAFPLFSPLTALGLQAIGPLLGIMFVVWSLFGELPSRLAWAQKLGVWLFPGIAAGTIILLLQGWPGSIAGLSPRVWLAYLSIVLVSITLEQSTLPTHIYEYCRAQWAGPVVVIPLYVLVAGLLGNFFDGVSIIAISVVIFMHLLPPPWHLRASFALLFGGLISNLITVAAEPTNIKFQDVLAPVLDGVRPSYWFTNWPIAVLGILLPTIWLFLKMRAGKVQWAEGKQTALPLFGAQVSDRRLRVTEVVLSLAAIAALAIGIIAHTIYQTVIIGPGRPVPISLWWFLVPAGALALIYLLFARMVARHHTPIPDNCRIEIDLGKRQWVRSRSVPLSLTHILYEMPIWFKLTVIFSLLWFLSNGLPATTNAATVFFALPESIRYGSMVVLSLLSSVTDNIALAAMQGSLILNHPIAIWQVRLLFILLAWSGGFTPFGCLQSLALNSRIRLRLAPWIAEAIPWALWSIAGGLGGLALIWILYPGAV